ncbi:MAG: LPS export ABC transporter periplasmic protein LptC [Rhizobiales bacterium]|nr:LPS export ABC transporter periplasmic protein LptC [Hyphomicrobiales bacterium]MBA67652.1 LPS export ABC transporter periplasmic protein LptC [Hyphomicrobiales bacterium]|tara:strand:+ start:1305 stop:1991 length:687 start_codon:yes stop_codon:yes gene_type:complete
MHAAALHTAVDGDGRDARSEREYRRALRHSRTVRRLKILLPVAAASLMVLFFAVSWVSSLVPEGVVVASTSIEDGKLVMHRPILTGENANNQNYELKADRAMQDLTTPNIIELEAISADVPVSDGISAKLEAESGIFDRTAETMIFDKPFTVTTSSGMTAKLQGADIDIRGGSMTSDKPVNIQLPEGTVDAESMRMTDKGNTIILERRVRMTIDPKAVEKTRKTGTAD